MAKVMVLENNKKKGDFSFNNKQLWFIDRQKTSKKPRRLCFLKQTNLELKGAE